MPPSFTRGVSPVRTLVAGEVRPVENGMNQMAWESCAPPVTPFGRASPLVNAGAEGGFAAGVYHKTIPSGSGKNDHTYLAHDLAVGPADKFQFIP